MPGPSVADAAGRPRLGKLLRERCPGLGARVEAHRRHGADAPGMLAPLAPPPPDFRPHLALWRNGAAEAVRGLSIGAMTDTLTAGIARQHDGLARGIMAQLPLPARR